MTSKDTYNDKVPAQTRPLFITFEGGEGVGKTTNIEYLKDLFEQQGIAFISTREPGGTPMAEELRQLLLSPREEKVCSTAELLLMFAARAQHLTGLIEPSLAQGLSVICDRFTDATYAYQGFGRELGIEKIATLEALVHGHRQPDITIVLDAPVEVGMSRARARGELDRFEQEKLAFFERVRQGYLSRAETNARYCVVDASLPLEEVTAQIQDIFEQRILPLLNSRSNACQG